ncbi:DUF3810 domain-containing protein [Hanstruepera ponticola]|uniref:DUF3810 domain-containing protein n=1 Tax=Hanstruepera ponticola TaxID=2042995 RepID=UPI000CF0163F|nr:DUF3810 domain-containing protein [Hanstruepera ponticola]
MRRNPKLYLALALIPQLIIIKILTYFPEFIETYYSNGLYQWISKLSRYIFGWLPFSFGDIFYALAIIYVVRWLIKNRWRFVKDLKGWIIDVFSAVSVIYFAFHVLWALNYYRQPLHENLGLQANYSTQELLMVTKKLIDKSNELHTSISKNDSLKIELPYSKNDILDLSPKGYQNLQNDYPHLAYSPPSLKKSLFSLPLTYMGFSGYLNPLTNEAHIDKLIPTYKFPTTVSHEIAHQLGYAAENEANFIGALAAISHDDIYFKYSGYTFALRHCLFEVYKRDQDLYFELVETINKGIIKNYQEVQLFWDSYQNPLEPFFKKTYDSYLIANNQKDGMQSYSYVVALLVNYLNQPAP